MTKIGMIRLPISFLFLLIHSQTITAIDSKNGGFDRFGDQNKNCEPFRCTKEYEPVPKWPLKLSSSGCGIIGGGISMGTQMNGFADDQIVYHCCDQYSACLQICGSTKAFCNKSFEKCVDDTCKAQVDQDIKERCEKNVETKKLLMSFTDCRPFTEGQKQGCECVEKRKVKEKRKSIIRAFYKKFSPDNMDKVDGLVSKANDTSKLAGLMIKLVSKYPKAIKRIEDPKVKHMEEMMKRAQESASENKRKSEKNSGKKTKVVDVDENDHEEDDEEDDHERIEL